MRRRCLTAQWACFSPGVRTHGFITATYRSLFLGKGAPDLCRGLGTGSSRGRRARQGLVKNASQIYGAIPALQQSFRKVAGADCGAYVFSRYRHHENLLPATAQHFLGNSAAEAIPGDQEAQSASLAPVFQFGKEDDEFALAALATPVLAFGKDQCSLAPQPRLGAVVQYRDVDFLRFSPDPPGDGESRN